MTPAFEPQSRRSFLRWVGIGGAAFLVRDVSSAFATTAPDPAKAPFLIHCTFEGGWDQLMALDPRDNTKYGAGAAIQPAYDQIQDKDTADVLAATNGTGLVRPDGSNLTFGPAVGKLSASFADLCAVRGLDMGTLTHEVGRRYFLTGKFPRGRSGSGSSLATAAVAQIGAGGRIPNPAVGMVR